MNNDDDDYFNNHNHHTQHGAYNNGIGVWWVWLFIIFFGACFFLLIAYPSWHYTTSDRRVRRALDKNGNVVYYEVEQQHVHTEPSVPRYARRTDLIV